MIPVEVSEWDTVLTFIIFYQICQFCGIYYAYYCGKCVTFGTYNLSNHTKCTQNKHQTSRTRTQQWLLGNSF
jgi:predicted ATP-dependent serine protease